MRDRDGTFAGARRVVLTASGYGSQAGRIDDPDDADFYRIAAPAPGALTGRPLAFGGNLDAELTVFDDSGSSIARAELGGAVRFVAVAGRAYFFRVGAVGTSTGAYELLFNDDRGNTPADAERIVIDAAESTEVLGSVDFAGDVDRPADADVFRFEAPATGLLQIRQEGTAEGALDSFLFVFDDDMRLIASSNDIDAMTADAAVVVNAARRQVYYVRATSSARIGGPAGLQTGPYRLRFESRPDDVAPNFEEAQSIPPVGATTGTINPSGDVDLFSFVAPATGRLPIRLEDDMGSGLDPVLVAFDDDRMEAARDDDAIPGTDSNSLVQLSVIAGRRYFLQASGYGTASGRYRLVFGGTVPDDRGTDAASATPVDELPVALPAAGKATFTRFQETFLDVAPRIGPALDVQQAVDAIRDALVEQCCGAWTGRATASRRPGRRAGAPGSRTSWARRRTRAARPCCASSCRGTSPIAGAAASSPRRTSIAIGSRALPPRSTPPSRRSRRSPPMTPGPGRPGRGPPPTRTCSSASWRCRWTASRATP